MVVLADTAPRSRPSGASPPRSSRDAYARIAGEHRMPIDTRERPYVAGSRDACRAVVAARVHADRRDRAEAPAQPADPQLRRRDARRPGDDRAQPPPTPGSATRSRPGSPTPRSSASSSATPPTPAARCPAARVLDHKLANWSGGRRYTCPSYEITRLEDGVTISIPGFQPFAVYDAILANLVPGLERREPPESAAEVLDWRAIPLSTQEVAVGLRRPLRRTRARSSAGSPTQDYVGADGFWHLDDEAMSRGRARHRPRARRRSGRGAAYRRNFTTAGNDPDEQATEVKILDPGETVKVSRSGAVGSVQEAEIIVERDFLERIWTPDSLELLARGYWAFLRKPSSGSSGSIYAHDVADRDRVRPDPAAPLRRPQLRDRRRARAASPGRSTAASSSPARAAARATCASRSSAATATGSTTRPTPKLDEVRLIARVEVENFYPGLRGRGWFARWSAPGSTRRRSCGSTSIVCNALPALPADARLPRRRPHLDAERARHPGDAARGDRR